MIKTEMRNPATTHIDKMSTAEMLTCIQVENIHAAQSVQEELPAITEAVDAIVERMKMGGRLFYIGCGTSGRLGVLDASECPPTYGVPQNLVIGLIAGGDRALRNAVEGAEDDEASGRRDLADYQITSKDSIVGISVAGGAAYVCGGLAYGREVGALTVSLTCNTPCRMESFADICIHPDTGAEVVTGSTRMKAGTAHKMILNMISTAVMIRLGCVYENLMINLRPSNIKLRQRMIRILCEILNCHEQIAQDLLERSEWDIRSAMSLHDQEMR